MNKKYINKAVFYLLLAVAVLGSINRTVGAELIPPLEVIMPPPTLPPRPDPTPTPTPIPVGPPIIRLLDPTQISMNAGAKKIVPISLRNAGLYRATNLIVTARAEQQAPFTVEIKSDQDIRSLQRGSTEILNLEFSVDSNATQGTYQVTLEYSYHNDARESFTGSDTINVRIDNETISPVIIISEYDVSSRKIESGSTFSVQGRLVNVTNQNATNIQVSVENFVDGIGLINDSSVRYYKNTQELPKEPFNFNFSSSKELKTGSYPINFRIRYFGDDGTEYTNEFVYYVYIENSEEKEEEEEKAIIDVTGIHSPSNIVSLGEEFEITINLANTGLERARNIKVEAAQLSSGGDGEAIVPKTPSVQQIQALEVSEEGEVRFRFSPTKASKTQSYTIGFNVTYETGIISESGIRESDSFSVYSGVNVYNPEEEEEEEEEESENRSVPKIIISRYSSEPNIVEAGQEFDLSLTFKNTSRESSVRNVKAFITVDEKSQEKGNVFSPVNASNTFYIEEIQPNGESLQNLKLYTVPDAETRTYTILINFEYEDEEAYQYTAVEQVGIKVTQSTSLDTANFTIPSTVTLTDNIPIMFDFFNTGNVKLSNVKVHLEVVSGNFDLTGTSVFYGTLEPGMSDYYDNMISPMEAGTLEGKVVLSFNDDTGSEHIEELPFTVEVQEDMRPSFDEMASPEDFGNESQGRPFWSMPSFWIGCAVAAIALIAAIRKGLFKLLAEKISKKDRNNKYE